MAKDVFNNQLEDIDMLSLLGDAQTETPTEKPEIHTDANVDRTVVSSSITHFTFICDKTIVYKVKAICNKEGVSIRDFIEHLLVQGITAYENKHGEATATKRNAAELF